MLAAVGDGVCVGTVPDGIAGIFRCSPAEEVVYLKERKGLAKLALRTGTPLLPVYSCGNTEVFSAWFDPFGWMEHVSRKLQAALFVYWGRFLLPIPRRVNITMLIGAPILVERVAGGEPTQAQVDELHERFLSDVQGLYERHKAALGWAHKRMVIV